jgi:hypothetical protein
MACARRLTAQVEPWAVKYMQPAFAGDAEAADDLYTALSSATRGTVAMAMWEVRVPRDAFRVFLRAAWEHDHSHVIAAAGTHRRLVSMFKYAAFPSPAQLPVRVTVWRGTTISALADTAYAWTTDRDVACWFAMRMARAEFQTVVMRAEVARSDIALYHDGRGEREAVLVKWPGHVVVDGDTEDWRVRAACCEERFRAADDAPSPELAAA